MRTKIYLLNLIHFTYEILFSRKNNWIVIFLIFIDLFTIIVVTFIRIPIMKTRSEMKRELQKHIPNGEEHLFLSTQEKRQEELQEELHRLEERRSTIRRAVTIRERKIRDWKGKIPREGDVPDKKSVRSFVGKNKTSISTVIGEVDHNDPSVINIDQFYAPALTGLTDFEKAWVFFAPKEEKSASMELVNVISWDRKKLTLRTDRSSNLSGRKIVDIKPYLPYCEAHGK